MKKPIFKCISIKTFKLTKKDINNICKLKNTYWNHGLKSQLQWFKKNLLNNDTHNCLIRDKKIIGYTCLRKRNYELYNKKKNYLLFDTLIIKKFFRNRNLGKVLMDYNNYIIKKKKLPSFLITTKKIKNFYNNNNWKQLNNKFFFKNHKIKKNKILMSYNFKKKLNKDLIINFWA